LINPIKKKIAILRHSKWSKVGYDPAKRNKKKVGEKMYAEKAVLIEGVPGIGKTTAAHVVTQSLGFEKLEFNASDVRSKKALEKHISILADNVNIHQMVQRQIDKTTPVKKKPAVLIMDEVDGMGRGDHRGVASLIQIIKKSKVKKAKEYLIFYVFYCILMYSYGFYNRYQ
jgi:replication factor C subunit 1